MSDRRANLSSTSLELAFAHLIGIQKRICECLVVMMVLLITAEVVSRGIFNHSLQVTHEIAGYLLVAVTFLSIGIALHERALFRVEFFLERLPKFGQRCLQLVFDLLALGFGIILDYQLIQLVVSSYDRGVREATILGTPLYLPQIAMPVGVTLMIVVLIMQIRDDIRAFSEPDTPITHPGAES